MKVPSGIAALVCVSLMLAAGTAEAASIGLNFVGGRSGVGGDGSGGTNGDDVLPTDLAGVPGYAQINWNNGFGANSGGPAPATGPVALVDNTNTPTGAVATWSGVPNSYTISGAAAAGHRR